MTELEIKVAEAGVTATVKYGNRQSNGDQAKLDDWQRTADPWTVTLRYRGRRLTTSFWTGSAHGEPTAAGVLACLLSDGGAVDETFDEWCANLGYDEDSRKALKTFKACQRAGKNVRKLLGDDYEDFVYLEH